MMKKNKKPIRISFFKPVKLNTRQSVRKVSMRNLTWPQASVRFPRLNPFGDADRDGKLNMFDCHPFDRKRHSAMSRDDFANRLFIGAKNSKGAYKEAKRRVMSKDNRQFNDEQLRKYALQRMRVHYVEPKVDYRTVEGKSIVEGITRRNFKTITPLDLIKHVEKHPQLIKSLEKVRKRFQSPLYLEGFNAYATPDGKEIVFAAGGELERDFGADVEHEIAHTEQEVNSKEQMRGNAKTLNELKKLPEEEYENMPIEIDAENRRKAKRKEWESWKKEQPEALKDLDIQEDLDLNDNQIPDTAEMETQDEEK